MSIWAQQNQIQYTIILVKMNLYSNYIQSDKQSRIKNKNKLESISNRLKLERHY